MGYEVPALMRVCFLAPELLPNQGGVGTYAVELLLKMAGRMEFTVLAPRRVRGTEVYDEDRLERYFGHGVRVRTISEARDTFVYNQAFQRAVRREVRRLVRTEGFDVLHSHHAHMPDLLLGSSRAIPPTVRTIHTTIEGQREGIRIARELGGGMESSERWQIALAPLLQTAEFTVLHRPRDTYIAVSGWMKKHLTERGLSAERIHVIHCGCDPVRFRPDLKDPTTLNAGPDARVVLFPGRPTIVKGSAVLARALPEVVRRVPEALFVFTGGGSEEFLRLVPLPPEVRARIRFLGYVPFDDLPKIFASADLVVAPTYYENFPIRILEAMASGAPVVASDVAGIPEVVRPGETGALVPPGDSGRLAGALVELLRDDAQRRRLGAGARALVAERFTWQQAADATLELYRAVAEGARVR